MTEWVALVFYRKPDGTTAWEELTFSTVKAAQAYASQVCTEGFSMSVAPDRWIFYPLRHVMRVEVSKRSRAT